MKKKYSLISILICFLFVGPIGCQHSKQNVEMTSMKRRIINPWTWQYKHGLSGFVHGNEVTNAHRMLFTAGQVSVNEDGKLLHPGDMEKQINQIIDNIEVLLDQADFELFDIVKLTYYTTNVEIFKNAAVQQVLIERLKKAGCKPATSLIGVNSLFHPECVVEIEAIAAK